jgi:hypothetical protein
MAKPQAATQFNLCEAPVRRRDRASLRALIYHVSPQLPSYQDLIATIDGRGVSVSDKTTMQWV